MEERKIKKIIFEDGEEVTIKKDSACVFIKIDKGEGKGEFNIQQMYPLCADSDYMVAASIACLKTSKIIQLLCGGASPDVAKVLADVAMDSALKSTMESTFGFGRSDEN